MQPGLRETKRVQTRLALCRAAVDLATEAGGTEEVTVEAIAERAQTSRRTFFNYFPTKDAAFVRPLYALGAAFTHALAERPDGEPAWEAVRHALHAALTVPEADPALIAAADALVTASPAMVLTTEAHAPDEPSAPELLRRGKAHIARLTGGDPDRDVYPQLVLETAGVALRVASRTWAARGGDPRGHVDTVVDLLRDGIRPQH
ncbi:MULTISPECIES: TetR family transcriptional regulator [Prauserella salsuginis group]|uniref:AcrR family transcriptional regulator n=2 Tax=Prauserella salsuginis group TaxID=2893672 RepID=A0A839XW16_9PSEU|nr:MULTISPECIES: TetR family transcriptional regulator [Prauserella salsuginis group]MBB3663975.1 AcrR family transcriptional regulator [Prauserella sediminis]MCR3721431.1 transcriptional regulator, TetR family [Prauserella flava]MCR3732421.1 transcriptional regulator, TetR family [Prauserella salsuginis]